ncbi:MAG TPA: hypothetical protein VE713_02295 [Pyrinomonadaceae bacterium]|nr:hypothetical protein [Pyrinomonadaceae bacterium]
MSAKWPPCEQSSLDIYQMDVETCEAARELWSGGCQKFAYDQLGDVQLGFDLMLEAAASVTKRRAVAPPERPIRDLRKYLRRSFRRLVIKEVKRRERFDTVVEDRRPDPGPEGAGPRAGGKDVVLGVEEGQEIDVLLGQLMEMMREIHPDFLRVSQALFFGHTLEEIAPHFGMKANALRAWYSRMMKKLRDRMRQGTGKE